MLFLDLALLPLRLVIGFAFVMHGYPKLTNERRKTIEFMQGKGVPSAITLLISLIEFFGGILLMVGLMTQIVAGVLAVAMFVITVFSVSKLGKKYLLGYELDIAYFTVSLTLALLGGGAFSLDRFLPL